MINKTILDAVQSEQGVRVSCGYRWLIWNPATQWFEVFERLPGQRVTRQILITQVEERAVKELINE